MEFAVLFILLVVVMILLVVYSTRIFTIMNYKYSQYACKASIKANQAAMVSKEEYGLKCPIIYETIPRAGGNDDERKEKYMGEIAERMAYTWNLFGEGSYDLFKVGATEDEKFCIITHHLEFDEGTDLANGNFLVYLKNHNAEVDREKRSYGDYLKPSALKGFDSAPASMVPSSYISTKKPVAIIYTYAKWSWLKQFLQPWSYPNEFSMFNLVFSAGDLDQAFSIRGGEWDSIVIVTPYDVENLKQLGCTNLPAEQQKINKDILVK